MPEQAVSSPEGKGMEWSTVKSSKPIPLSPAMAQLLAMEPSVYVEATRPRETATFSRQCGRDYPDSECSGT